MEESFVFASFVKNETPIPFWTKLLTAANLALSIWNLFNMHAIGATMFVFGILAMIGTRIGGYAADRWGTVNTIVVGIGINALALFVLPFSITIMITTLVVASIWVGASNTIIPALQTYLVQQEPQSSELALSASSSVAQLGLALGTVLGGIMVTISGKVAYNPWLGAIIVLIGLLSAIMTFFYREKAMGS